MSQNELPPISEMLQVFEVKRTQKKQRTVYVYQIVNKKNDEIISRITFDHPHKSLTSFDIRFKTFYCGWLRANQKWLKSIVY